MNIAKDQYIERKHWRFGRYNGQNKSNSVNPRFGYVRLGESPTPAKIRNARGKGWRFFEWVFQKILPEPCMENSPYRLDHRVAALIRHISLNTDEMAVFLLPNRLVDPTNDRF